MADDRSNHGGRGQLRIIEGALGLLQQCVEDHYFGTDGSSFSYCHRQVVREFETHNKLVPEEERLKIPGYKQMVHFIRSLPAYEVVAAKFGRSFAREHFTAVKYRNVAKLRPLERVEIDHTPLDIYALSDEGIFLGRVRLTLVIDVRCKAIIGYSIGFGAPSASAVLEALRHACTPKTYLRERYPDIRNAWPMHGMIGLLAMDNGQEFHSKSKFKASIIEFSMASEFAWMPRKKGRYKGLIEAIQKYLNRQAMDNQPGATGSHPHVRKPSEVPPEQYTVFKLSDLHRLLHTYICDVHNVSGHGKSKIVPLKTWQELTSLTPVRLPGHYDRLELACTTGVLRRIQPYGLDVADLRSFNSDALQAVRRLYEHQGTVQVQVRYREALLDKVWFKHPGTGEWIEVPNHDPDTCNKSAYQVKLMRRMQRESEKDGGAHLQVAEAYRRMRDIGLGLLTAKTIAQRKRGLQLLGLLPGTSAEYLDARTQSAAQSHSTDLPRRTRSSRPAPSPRPAPTSPPAPSTAEHIPVARPPAPAPLSPISVPKALQQIGGTKRPLF
ncbi:hypothetical protein ACPWT1_03975 [Ramlibacter sp. MMS24-I3-19]|uniref:hypothetical protein n=1 Tax=Ramlibacter sp. MMS24-I3-19 TaxID=3416606 RepID=UPI003D095580